MTLPTPTRCLPRRLALPPLLLASLALAACSDGDRHASGASLSLAPCADDTALDCGVMDVPLIHDSTDTRRMAIDVVRLPGTGSGPHETLMVNPGGPGGSGTWMVREFARRDALPAAVRERYDLVGFDPRGIGASERIDCGPFELDELDDYPPDAAAMNALVDDSVVLADACSAEVGDRLQWLGSNAVVADMDALRMLLDAPLLNLVGYSYGTRLAALYLQRFPGSSGRIVLDASLPPDAAILPLVTGQVEAQQRNLELLWGACGTAVPACDPGTFDAALGRRLQALLAPEDGSAFELFGTLVLTAVESPLAAGPLAPILVQYVLDGRLEPLIELAQASGVDIGESAGDDDGPGDDNGTVRRAVLCADDAARPDRDALAATLDDLDRRSDLFGESQAAIAASCAGWPAALDPLAPIATEAAPVSLVIGGRYDAQTPIEWAQLMAEAIGGRFLASDHDGHTSVFNGESACVDDIVTAFLLDGTLPDEAGCSDSAVTDGGAR